MQVVRDISVVFNPEHTVSGASKNPPLGITLNKYYPVVASDDRIVERFYIVDDFGRFMPVDFTLYKVRIDDKDNTCGTVPGNTSVGQATQGKPGATTTAKPAPSRKS